MDTRREKFVREEKLTSRQGQTVWLQTIKRPLIGPDGTARHVLGVSMDITERKLAADRIREQAMLLDLTPDAIFVLDLERKIQFWNEEAANLYGWTAGEAVGRRYEEVFAPASVAHLEVAEQTVLEKGEWSGEFNRVSRTGREMMISGRWKLLRDETGKPRSVLIINSDVTGKKRLEAELLRAQRMEGIGTLAAGMAHDLNNILAPIGMSAESLRWDLAPAMREAAINRIEMSVKRGAGIIQQVLTFSRGIYGQRLAINPAELLAEVMDLVKQTFPENIALAIEAEPGVWAMTGDRAQLRQVLLNLANNSREAMPNGGQLRMRAGNVLAADLPASRPPSASPGPHVQLCVEDTGCGIPAANLEKVFDPFFTTKELGKGSGLGLGLATVLGIVKSHEGFVTVESEPNKGATFKVFLPATVTPEA
jgi:PAS domain S-box-containing protein